MKNEREKIFCPVRRKWLQVTPEELVRQQVIRHINDQELISFALMAVEKQIPGSKKRFDLVIYDQDGTPQILVECKRESEKLSQATFDQISRYNKVLHVPFLVITNWTQWLAAKIDGDDFTMLSGFPKL